MVPGHFSRVGNILTTYSTPGNKEQSPRGTFRSADVTSSNVDPKREENSENRRGRGTHSPRVVKAERTEELEEKAKDGRATDELQKTGWRRHRPRRYGASGLPGKPGPPLKPATSLEGRDLHREQGTAPSGTFRSSDVTSSNIDLKREEKSENGRGRGTRSLGVVKEEEERTEELEEEEKAKDGRATEDGTEASALRL
ncbi:hypothetical protein NDU88_004413 [Pleurodeles waltl]|uniref:Uncharacterized protein n=1 Tax=Pleurodeles waltl TaxID=8319 RepID=A0AAV7NTM5_PLEWA|nr:hypothetical protein NDU88_004413 [Pleurodeles waltl]